MTAAAAAQQIVQRSGSNFALSFLFLSKEKRRAMNAIYAFCRCVDDIADSDLPLTHKKADLTQWRRELDYLYQARATHPMAHELFTAIERFHIPQEYLSMILSGVEMDLEKSRYATFEELGSYCHRVASAVGWVCLCIFEHHNSRTKDYATNLGVSFQLTNILRDLKTDAARKRIYLPQEDLVQYGYSEEDLFHQVTNEPFARLMQFEVARAKRYFQAARGLLVAEDHRPLLAAQIMDRIYFDLLERIEARPAQVFREKMIVPKPKKLALALSAWMKAL